MRLIVYHGTPWQRENTRRFVLWYTKRFIPKSVQARLYVQVRIDVKDVPELGGDQGVCEYLDEDCSLGWEHCKIDVLAPPNVTFYKFLSRLAHECVHVKQYATHEMKFLSKGVLYRKVKYDDSAPDMPWVAEWEVAAFGMEVYLVNEYASAFNIQSSVFTPKVRLVL